MRDKIKKFLKRYSSANTIDGLLCGISIFVLLRSPQTWIFVGATLAIATIIFSVATFLHKKQKLQQTTDFIRGFSLIIYLASIIQIITIVICK